MKIQPLKIIFQSFLLAVFALSTAGCQKPNAYAPPPPPTVTIAKPLYQTVANYKIETGTTEAYEFAEIRARVKGILKEVKFDPNQVVKAGDVLYQIEIDQYEAEVKQAEATLASAKAEELRAEAAYERMKTLFAQASAPEEDVETAKAAYEVAKAGVKGAEAALTQAELNRSYTTIKAPFDGMMGKTLVYEGNLVGNNEATHLTTIVRYDPIFATFSVSERELLEYIEERPKRPISREERESVVFYLGRGSDPDFPFKGHLDYTELFVDQSTGTYEVRGVFDNPDLKILPGLYVKIRIPQGTQENAILIPDSAIGADQAGRYVYVYTDKGEVERRDVVLGELHQSYRAIVSGIERNDKVIIKGIQRIQPGSPVTVNETTLPPLKDMLPKDPVLPADPPTENASASPSPPKSEPATAEPPAAKPEP